MITNINTYLPELQKMFPGVCKSDIRRMIQYGWRMFYYYNLRGCDVVISSRKSKFWFYCGRLCDDSLSHFRYYVDRLCRKIRVMYNKRKIQWDNYYYIGLNQEEYEQLSTVKRGRPKKYFQFKKKVAFKIKDEAMLQFARFRCIVKYKSPVDLGYAYYKEILKCESPEVVSVIDKPYTFKDILITNYDYEML